MLSPEGYVLYVLSLEIFPEEASLRLGCGVDLIMSTKTKK